MSVISDEHIIGLLFVNVISADGITITLVEIVEVFVQPLALTSNS